MNFSTLNLITEFQHIIPLSISDENIYICKYQKNVSTIGRHIIFEEYFSLITEHQ